MLILFFYFQVEPSEMNFRLQFVINGESTLLYGKVKLFRFLYEMQFYNQRYAVIGIKSYKQNYLIRTILLKILFKAHGSPHFLTVKSTSVLTQPLKKIL